MLASPRVVFSFFASVEDAALRAWMRFRREIEQAPVLDRHRSAGLRSAPVIVVVPAPAPSATVAARFVKPGVWRLLASNNRELARSAQAYASLAEARAHALEICERVDELVVVEVIGPLAGTRGWYLTLDSVIVVTCSRRYGGVVSTQKSHAAALSGLRFASIAEQARAANGLERRHSASASSSEVHAWTAQPE